MIQLQTLTAQALAGCIDHTLLKAFAVREDFQQLCAQARQAQFASVAVNPARVALCKELLEGSGVRVTAVAGFPLGQTTVADKVSEARRAIENGADEVDYVLNVGELRDGNLALIEREMSELVAVCHQQGAGCKVIFETCYLTQQQILDAAAIARRVKPDFIKTSTGFGTGGATVETVRLMAGAVAGSVRVKASGGIRSWADCRAMLEAGAERIGTSAGPAILAEFLAQQA